MKTSLVAFAALAALSAAAPAVAQYGTDPYRADRIYVGRLDQLESRVDMSAERGAISPSEAHSLRTQIWRLRGIEREYSRSGISAWEQSDLDARVSGLWVQLRDSQTDGYGSRYGRSELWYDRDRNGYDDRSDRNGDGYADSLDRNNDGYNDLYDRDGNGYDDRYDRNGDGYDDRSPYTADPMSPEYYDSLSNPVGTNDWLGDEIVTGGSAIYAAHAPQAPMLRVGDRAPDTLSPVPPQFRSLYADGKGVVYRYDNGAVYQIDGSGMVRWVGRLPEY